MKSNDTYKRKIFNAIMQHIPGSMRDWSNQTGISIGTFSGWKTGTHLPREDSLRIFTEFLSDYLRENTKKDIYDAILDVIEPGENSKTAIRLSQLFQQDFVEFIHYILSNYDDYGKDSVSLQKIDQGKMYEILCIKLENWMKEKCSGTIAKTSVGSIWSRVTLCFQKCEFDSEIVLISYSLEEIDRETVTEYIKQISMTEAYSIHILFIILDSGMEQNCRYIQNDRTLVHKFDYRYPEKEKVDHCFVLSADINAKQILAMNQIARKMMQIIKKNYCHVHKPEVKQS